MKFAMILVSLVLSLPVWGSSAESSFTCTSGTNSGDVVKISGCISVEADSLVSCVGDAVPYVTITKELWAAAPKMTPPVVESAKIPAVYFTFFWDEELFSLELNDKSIGQVSLAFVAVPGLEANNQFVLKTKTFNNSFKVVGCEFGFNR